MSPIGKFGVALAAGFLAFSPNAFAYVTTLPPSLAQETLSETVPTAFEGFALAAEDYAVEWLGPRPEGIELGVVPNTVQWVRVADVLVLPRGRIGVKILGADAARVTNAGFSQALVPPPTASSGAKGALEAEMPVSLISGEQNPIEVAYRKGGRDFTARAVLRFKPRAELGEERVFYDHTCSRFGVRATGLAQTSKAKGWAYVGCRVAEVEGQDHRTSSLEAWVYWDNVGQTILVGGVPTPSSSVSVWPLRLRAAPGKVQLALPGGADEMTISYSTPENFHRGSLGMGIGPYWDRYEGRGQYLSQVAPVVTLYGSYFITEQLRIVSFGAATLDRHYTTDVGVYANTEYLKFIDRRVVINLLLGVHANGFMSHGEYKFVFNAPQGVEMHLIDLFAKAKNLSGGFFFYPLIEGRSYANIWLRYGSARFFWELNYIAWEELLDGDSIRSRSAGISVGFPIPGARFL